MNLLRSNKEIQLAVKEGVFGCEGGMEYSQYM